MQSEAKSAAYQMRMDRYRGDLSRINTTWNEMDGIAEVSTRGGPHPFDAPPAPPEAVVSGDGKTLLNMYCAKYRDDAASWSISKQVLCRAVWCSV